MLTLRAHSAKPAQNGWIFVHLQGAPFDIGYQHGVPIGSGN